MTQDKRKKQERQPVPFDDALRKILSAPPQHKKAKKRSQKSKRS